MIAGAALLILRGCSNAIAAYPITKMAIRISIMVFIG
jgi:hypothetical protein